MWDSNTIFPPPYVISCKDHWKIGESEYHTDCDVTVGVTNSYAPTFVYTRSCSVPAASRTCTAEWSEDIQLLWRNKLIIAKWQIMEINVIFQAVQGMWSAGVCWCLYSERHGKQITRSNKIMRATKGTWLASCLRYPVTLQYIRFHLPHKQSKERWLRMMMNDLQILSTTDKHMIL